MHNTPHAISAAPTRPDRIFHTLPVFRCPTALSEALAEHAEQQNMTSISAAIHHLIQSGLAEHHRGLRTGREGSGTTPTGMES
jgi:hypothetical protein